MNRTSYILAVLAMCLAIAPRQAVTDTSGVDQVARLSRNATLAPGMPRAVWGRRQAPRSPGWTLWLIIPAVVGIGSVILVVVLGRRQRDRNNASERQDLGSHR
ncbi:MAG: hypothetical protein KGY99_00325 [Phycisphaerae bacterium]|nr:hypothetical protein [Phycisphaerae bacterium]